MTVVTAPLRSKGAAQRDDRGRPDIVPVLFHPGEPRVGVVVHVGLLALPGVGRPLPQPHDGVLAPLHRVRGQLAHGQHELLRRRQVGLVLEPGQEAADEVVRPVNGSTSGAAGVTEPPLPEHTK